MEEVATNKSCRQAFVKCLLIGTLNVHLIPYRVKLGISPQMQSRVFA